MERHAAPESSRSKRRPGPGSDEAVIFSPKATTLFRLALVGAVGLIFLVGATVFGFYRSSYWNGVGLSPSQPVLFSHRHHAGELQIDCRYCHAGVETSAFAGMPATETCLSCHSQIFTQTSMLEPVVQSSFTGIPLRWNRVTRLPDHVYFDHSIHVNKGVGCTTCHGDVGSMGLAAKAQTMTMRWCLDCHRDPGPQLRPQSQIFIPSVPAAQEHSGGELMRFYDIHKEHLTNCSTCHR